MPKPVPVQITKELLLALGATTDSPQTSSAYFQLRGEVICFFVPDGSAPLCWSVRVGFSTYHGINTMADVLFILWHAGQRAGRCKLQEELRRLLDAKGEDDD